MPSYRLTGIGWTTRMVTTAWAWEGADKSSIDTNKGNQEFLQWIISRQCVSSESINSWFDLWSTVLINMTTTSRPRNKQWLWRKLSLITRFILFLPTAVRTCFFEITRPSRARLREFLLVKTNRRLSRERFDESKTALNSDGRVNLLFLNKRPLVHDTISLFRRSASFALLPVVPLKQADRPLFAYEGGIHAGVCV